MHVVVIAVGWVVLAQVSPVQVAAPDLSVVNLDPNRGALFAEHLAQQLTSLGFSVTTAKQIGSLLGQERQRQLMGCSDASTSCMAELAAALGSDAVVTGSVAKLESSYQVNVALISARDGKPVSVMSAREATEEGVLDALTREAPRLATESYRKLRPGHTLTPPLPGLRRLWWAPAAGAVVFVGIGAGLFASAWADDDRLRGVGSSPMRLSLADARATVAAGELKQTFAVVSLAAAGLAALASLAFLVFGNDRPAMIAVAPLAAGGVLVGLSGSFR